MWVLYEPEATSFALWQTLEENEFFELQAHKASKPEGLLSSLITLPGSLLQGVSHSLKGGSTPVVAATEEAFPYRILLKARPPYG